jgi:SOS-response transcriptional repressor LexA
MGTKKVVAMNVNKKLPAHLKVTLDLIKGFIGVHGYSPTIRELAALAGITSSAVQFRVRRLEEHGSITKNDGAARSIRLKKIMKSLENSKAHTTSTRR